MLEVRPQRQEAAGRSAHGRELGADDRRERGCRGSSAGAGQLAEENSDVEAADTSAGQVRVVLERGLDVAGSFGQRNP